MGDVIATQLFVSSIRTLTRMRENFSPTTRLGHFSVPEKYAVGDHWPPTRSDSTTSL